MGKKKQYFNLFSCCIPVKGYNRAIICDLQRDRFDFIPLGLYDILTHLVKTGKNIHQIENYYNPEKHVIINEYFDFLINKEYGFMSEKYHNLPELEINSYYEPRVITNSIIDFYPKSKHTIELPIAQLSDLLCEALELRFFYSIDITTLSNIIDKTEGSTIRDLEVLLKYIKEYTIDNIINLRKTYRRIRKITLYNAPYNKFYEHEEIVIIFTKSDIYSEECCGVINPWYFISKTEVFIESKKYNSCLNRKICIDKDGNIKNCPSMKFSYGNISETTLHKAISHPDFSSLWNINKDQIEVCKDCEMRYICQDCRAYICNPNNLLSKPLKCKYNPYE